MPTPKTAYIEISKQQNLYKHTILKGRWSDWLCTGGGSVNCMFTMLQWRSETTQHGNPRMEKNRIIH